MGWLRDRLARFTERARDAAARRQRAAARAVDIPETWMRLTLVGLAVLAAGLLLGAWALPALWMRIAGTGLVLAVAGGLFGYLAAAAADEKEGDT